MGDKDPSGSGSDIKDEAGNLAGTGRELLWKIRGETGKATVLAWGERPWLNTSPPRCLSRRCQMSVL